MYGVLANINAVEEKFYYLRISNHRLIIFWKMKYKNDFLCSPNNPTGIHLVTKA
jgi:histidinol-phosphate/aromatic aminotransferase/cobyric acid decarboxylase-like protein